MYYFEFSDWVRIGNSDQPAFAIYTPIGDYLITVYGKDTKDTLIEYLNSIIN